MSSVTGVSSLFNPYQVNSQSDLSQKQQDFSDLGTALQSGDLTTAQSLFSALFQNTAATSSTQAVQQNGSTGIKADIDALGQALQTGNVSAAQTAYSKLQQDFQNIHAHRHHHHQVQGTGDQNASSSSVTDLLQTDSSSDSSSIGSINITG